MRQAEPIRDRLDAPGEKMLVPDWTTLHFLAVLDAVKRRDCQKDDSGEALLDNRSDRFETLSGTLSQRVYVVGLAESRLMKLVPIDSKQEKLVTGLDRSAHSIRSASVIGRSLMLASRRCMSPDGANSQSSFP